MLIIKLLKNYIYNMYLKTLYLKLSTASSQLQATRHSPKLFGGFYNKL